MLKPTKDYIIQTKMLNRGTMKQKWGGNLKNMKCLLQFIFS